MAQPQESETVVDVQPPPERVERVAPRPGAVWNPGYWNWNARDRRYVWVGGTYVPVREGYTWVPARWVHVARGWRLQPGHWAPGGEAAGRPNPPRPMPMPYPGQHAPMPMPYPGSGRPGPGENGPAPGGLVTEPPPAPRIEPIVQRPGFVFAPGYWQWDGNHYAWVKGDYVRNRPGFSWVRAQWVREPRGWHFQPGHWERG